jgi:protein SCO1
MSKAAYKTRLGTRGRRRGGEVRVIAVLGASVAVAIWMLIRSVLGTDNPQQPPRIGVQIDASFAGLRDPRGEPLDERSIAGRYRLVTFGFTTCPDVCPLTLLGVHQALDQLGPDATRVLPIFISVDPQRDTPELLTAYVNSFDRRIMALAGPSEVLARIASHYRVVYRKKALDATAGPYVVEHTAVAILVDPQQRIQALIPTSEPPAQIASQIVAALRARKPHTVSHVSAVAIVASRR